MAAPPPGAPLAALGLYSLPITSSNETATLLLVLTVLHRVCHPRSLGKSPLLFPGGRSQFRMVAACGCPVRRAPAGDSPIRHADSRFLLAAALSLSLYDAPSSRRFSGWQLNKNSRSPSSFSFSPSSRRFGSLFRWRRPEVGTPKRPEPLSGGSFVGNSGRLSLRDSFLTLERSRHAV